MSFMTSILILAGVSLLIYLVIEVRRFKHKVFAIFLIVLLVMAYLSFLIVFKGKEVDFKSAKGMKEATGVYLSWLGSVFHNLKIITSNAINLEWGYDNKSIDFDNKFDFEGNI